MACTTSIAGTVQAAGMVGCSDLDLALVGGAESMSHVAIALRYKVAERVVRELSANPANATKVFAALTPGDFNLPSPGWVSRATGRSMGEHMEDTAKELGITRSDQDERALLSHQGAIRAQSDGFFSDLIVPHLNIDGDTLPRANTSPDLLAKLPAVFDRSAAGTLTAGNSSPLTDGAAGIWVADAKGLERLGARPTIKLVDWELAAVDFLLEGMLMAPAYAIPRLLARQNIRAEDIDVWEIHEAFAAQVLANIKAVEDPRYRKNKAGVNADIGTIPVQRVNRNGGSIALGHPFAATGARILSQAAKELSVLPAGARALVSVCADGGQGAVVLLQRV
jgi:acetyl-CoA C-acetyltransferase